MDIEDVRRAARGAPAAAAAGRRRLGADRARARAPARPDRGALRPHTATIPTPELNRLPPGAARAAAGAASRRGRRLNLLYGTQVAVRPPRFRIFVNDPGLMTRDYGYWVENRLRERFGLAGVPRHHRLRAARRDRARVVVGGGSWGSTFAALLAERGHEVALACRDAEQARAIAETGRNPRYLRELDLSRRRARPRSPTRRSRTRRSSSIAVPSRRLPRRRGRTARRRDAAPQPRRRASTPSRATGSRRVVGRPARRGALRPEPRGGDRRGPPGGRRDRERGRGARRHGSSTRSSRRASACT